MYAIVYILHMSNIYSKEQYMIDTILTPENAKLARAFIGLSQNKVAQSVGISRTNLALYEVKKYLLDDQALTRLKQFYIDTGYSFDDGSTVVEQASEDESADNDSLPDHSSGVRLMDGYAIPEGFDEDKAERILSEIYSNDQAIAELSGQVPDVAWFSDEPDTDGLDQLVRLSARNYALVRCLQGHDWLNDLAANDASVDDAVTNGMLFNAKIGR